MDTEDNNTNGTTLSKNAVHDSSNNNNTLPVQTVLQDGSTTPVLTSRKFVLVVSQYSQKDEFNFTIKVYSRVHTTLTQLPPLIPPTSGAWISCYRKVGA